jgi:flagellar protein FlbD
MITLHRIAHENEEFSLNPDLIATVEACPDTVVHLATGARLLVTESPEEVAELVREWRVSCMSAALSQSRGLDRLPT